MSSSFLFLNLVLFWDPTVKRKEKKGGKVEQQPMKEAHLSPIIPFKETTFGRGKKKICYCTNIIKHCFLLVPPPQIQKMELFV